MASRSTWRSLEKPLNDKIVDIVENHFGFERMTPVQVSTSQMCTSKRSTVAYREYS